MFCVLLEYQLQEYINVKMCTVHLGEGHFIVSTGISIFLNKYLSYRMINNWWRRANQRSSE